MSQPCRQGVRVKRRSFEFRSFYRSGLKQLSVANQLPSMGRQTQGHRRRGGRVAGARNPREDQLTLAEFFTPSLLSILFMHRIELRADSRR